MIEIRASRPEEIPQQKELWKRAFGDSSAYVDIFYQKFCTPEQALVVVDDGDINSMAVFLPSAIQFPDGTSAPVAYVYALATNPYIQGQGHARQLFKFTDQYLQERGFKAVTLVPDSPSLHRFFEAVGMEECFGIRKIEILASALTGDTKGGSMTPATPKEYNEIRERYLKGTFHVTYTDDLIHLQQIGSHMASADLYKIEVNGEVGCAAIEYVQSRRLLIKELMISSANMLPAVEIIAKELDAARYHVRTPVFWDGIHGSYQQAFGMIKWYDRELQNKWFSHQDGYMGLGFE